eukprot:441878-Amphidinium_carterae.1
MHQQTETPYSECRFEIDLLSTDRGIKSRLLDHIASRCQPPGRVTGIVQRVNIMTKVVLEGSNEDLIEVMEWMRDKGARDVQVGNYIREAKNRKHKVFKILLPNPPPPRAGS